MCRCVFRTLACRKNAFKHSYSQWNAGTACVSECVLKMLACRDLRVGPSKVFDQGMSRVLGLLATEPDSEPQAKKGGNSGVRSQEKGGLSKGGFFAEPSVTQENYFVYCLLTCTLSGVIRANRFARFARIGWFARIGNSSDSCESAWRTIKIGVSIANDSRESIRANRVANRPCHLSVHRSTFMLYASKTLIGSKKWYPANSDRSRQRGRSEIARHL